MACTALEGVQKGCDNNMGGIVALYINDQDNLTSVTENTATWQVTAITCSPRFETFEFNRNVGNFIEEETKDPINGSSFVKQTITTMLHRREGSKSRKIKILGEGMRDLAIIAKDANGIYWYFPYSQLTSVTEGSGTAKADGSKYSLTFVAENEFLAKTVDSAIIANLLTPIS